MLVRTLVVLLAIAGVAFAALAAISHTASKPLFDEARGEYAPRIAPLDEALTFARTESALLLVTAHEVDRVRGLDLTAALGREETGDLLALFRARGFDGLRDVTAPEVEIPIDALEAPIAYPAPHVAAGTNFKAHAEEVYLDDPPFLFPKRVEATAWNADVPFTSRLDYEAELCMIPIDDLVAPDAEARFAVVLCNEGTLVPLTEPNDGLVHETLTPQGGFLTVFDILLDHTFKIIDIVDIGVVQPVDVGVDVAWHGDVDKKERPAAAAAQYPLDLVPVNHIVR